MFPRSWRCKRLAIIAAGTLLTASLIYHGVVDSSKIANPRKRLCSHTSGVLPSLDEGWDKEIKDCPDGGRNPYETRTDGWRQFKEALERYREFHHEQVRALRGMRKGSVSKVAPRTLTWVCDYGNSGKKEGCGGLGDQLPRITLFLLMAMVSDRVFTVKWDENFKKTTHYLLPNAIEWSYFDETLGMCSDRGNTEFTDRCSHITFSKTSLTWDSWSQDDWAAFGKVLFSPEPHVTVVGRVNVGSMMIADNEFVQPNTLMRKRLEDIGVTKILALDMDNKIDFTYDKVWFTYSRIWYTAPWFYMSRLIFHYLFRLSPEIAMKANVTQRLLGQKYLAVHLRTGFQGNFFQGRDKMSTWNYKNWKMFPEKRSWKYIMDHAITLANERLGENSNIFLATDSGVAKDWIVETYGERIIVANITIIHSGKLATQADCQGSLGLWVDFYLLGHAHYLVHGSSSYALSASMLCAMPPLRHSWFSYEDKTDTFVTHIGTNIIAITT